MKHALMIFAFLLFATSAFSQNTKGFSVPKTAENNVTGKTYALIVGVAKYKNPAIPQLQYADRDAMAFYEYLKACGVDTFNIYLLLNEHATDGDFWADLADLTEKAQKGDKVFFYFSGHGDVESKVITQDAYLLPYDAPKVAYASGAIGIYYVKGYLATLSSKGVQVVFITDACHSGNLAGGREGMENAANVLKGQWKDEIKILSCEPGELSLEGKQWGGGRGLFSYVLINGMAGDADNDKDGTVSLRELNIYMMQKVPSEANPVPQNPVLTGNMGTTISTVNNEYLKTHAKTETLIAAVNTRGIEEGLLKNLPDSIKHFYADFKELLEKGPKELWAEGFTKSKRDMKNPSRYVIAYGSIATDSTVIKFFKKEGFDSSGTFHIPDSMAHYYKECTLHNDSDESTPIMVDDRYAGNGHPDTNNSIKKYRISAFDYIKKIPENEQTKLLLGIMRRNLIADEINKIENCVKADIEYNFVWYFRNLYFSKVNIPIPELHMLTNLLGETKLKEMGIYPKLYYINARLNVFGNKEYSFNLSSNGFTLLDSAISIDTMSAYAYFLKSSCYFQYKGNYDSAIKYAKKALIISPNILACYHIIGNSYRLMNQLDSSIMYFKRLQKIIYSIPINAYWKNFCSTNTKSEILPYQELTQIS